MWLLAACMSFLAAYATVSLTSDGRDIATIWPANAILVALLLADDNARWRAVLSAGFVANLAANYLTRGTVAGPLLYGVANVVEIMLAATLLRRRHWQGSILYSTRGVVHFILVAGILAPLVSGVIGSFTAHWVFGEPIGKSLLTWMASDGLGLLVFTPFCFAIFRGDFISCFTRKTALGRCESIACIVLTAAVAYAIFFVTKVPLLFLVYPPLLLLTFRMGPLGAKTGVMVIAIVGGLATIQGTGPITLISPHPAIQAQAFQAFLAVLLLTCLPVAAEVTSRARLTATLVDHDQQMTALAMTDPLTGILNRGGFENAAHTMFDAQSEPLSLIAIDFDHFKRINDRWGHLVGDLALKHLTSVLQAHVRARDLLGRLGGDEFMILLPHTSDERARSIAERIRAAVHGSPMTIDATNTAMITLSIGVATAQPQEDYEALLQRADRALYKAKASGRNTIRSAA